MVIIKNQPPAKAAPAKRKFKEVMNFGPSILFAMVKQTEKQRLTAKVLKKTPAKVKTKRGVVKHNLDLPLTLASPLNTLKVNLDFLTYSRPLYFEFQSEVLDGLTDNANFTTPEPALSVITDEKVLYDIAHGDGLTLAANQHLANMKYAMKQLGVYVANECDNDEVIFATSKFIPNALKPGPSVEIGKAVIRGIRDTRVSGNIIVTVAKVEGANFYKGFWKLVSDPDGPWNQTRGGAGVKVKFNGLPTEPLDVYVVASGPLNDGDPSDTKPYTPR